MLPEDGGENRVMMMVTAYMLCIYVRELTACTEGPAAAHSGKSIELQVVTCSHASKREKCKCKVYILGCSIAAQC